MLETDYSERSKNTYQLRLGEIALARSTPFKICDIRLSGQQNVGYSGVCRWTQRS